jgi:hypothetical protein
MSKDNVIDFDGVRPSDQFEVIFAPSGVHEQAVEGAIATLRTSTSQKEVDEAIALLIFMGAKLDELESLGVEI